VIGGEESTATLKSVMDKLEEAQATAADQRTPPNFRVIINVNQLVEMAEIAREVSMTRRQEREAAAGAEAALAQTPVDTPAPGAPGAGAAPAPGAAPAGGPGAGRGFGRGGRGRGGFQPNPAQAAAMQRRAEQGRRIAMETLKEGDDRIEIDSRLTETGARLRVRLEQGFVKMFGRLVANGISGGEAESDGPGPVIPIAAPQGDGLPTPGTLAGCFCFLSGAPAGFVPAPECVPRETQSQSLDPKIGRAKARVWRP
jgi:hypothetical protein